MGRTTSSTAGDPLIGCTVGEGCRIIERMAVGGLSAVYRAERADGGEAAVKVLEPLYLGVPTLRRRFAQEARLLKRLRGRGAPEVLAAGQVAGRPYLVLEL